MSVVCVTLQAGLFGPTSTVVFLYDATPPIASVETGPSGAVASSDAQFQLGCNEVCSYDFRLDAGPWTAVGGKIGDTGAESATAAAANVTSAFVAFQQVPPPVVAGPLVATLPFTVALPAGPNVTGTAHAVVNGRLVQQWQLSSSGASQLVLTNVTDGTVVVTAAVDGGVAPASFVVLVDSVAPVLSVWAAPADGDLALTPTVVVAVDDDDGDVEYFWRHGTAGEGVAGAPWRTSRHGVLTVPSVSPTVRHAVEVYAVDAAGHASPLQVVEWTPTGCPPAAAVPGVTLAAAPNVGPGARYVVFRTNDAALAAWSHGFEWALDDGAWTPTADPVVTLAPVPAPGASHVVRMRAAVPPVCNAALQQFRPAPASYAWREPPAAGVGVAVWASPPTSTPDVFAAFQWSAAVLRGSVQYALDGGPWVSGGVGVRLGPLAAGQHDVQLRAVNGSMVPVGAPASVQWTVTSAADSSVVLAGLADGNHTLHVRSTDEAGLLQVGTSTRQWVVDTTPPTTSATLLSAAVAPFRFLRAEVTCTDASRCTVCWAKGPVPDGCTTNSTLVLPVPSDGPHLFEVHCVDEVGNVDDTPLALAFVADTIPPVATVAAVAATDSATVNPPTVAPCPAAAWSGGAVHVGPVMTNRRAIHVVLGTDEPLAQYEVALYAVPEAAAAPPVVTAVVPGTLHGTATVVAPTDGAYIVVVTATDVAGNVQPMPGTRLGVVVDTLPPLTTEFSPPLPQLTNNATLTVHARGTDGVDGVGVVEVHVTVAAIDADATGNVSLVVTAASGWQVESPTLHTGTYTFTAVAVDALRHVVPATSSAAAVTNVTVDRTAPHASFPTPPPTFWPSTAVPLPAATDEAGSLQVRVEDGAWLPHAAPWLVTVPGQGPWTLWVRAVDVAGNVESPATLAAIVTVDEERPAVAWLPGSLPPAGAATRVRDAVVCVQATDASPVHFNVSVTVPPAAATTTAVTGNPCVTLSPPDGAVTVEFVAVDAAGNAGAPLSAAWDIDTVAPEVVVGQAVADAPTCVAQPGATVCPSVSAATVAVSCAPGAGTPCVTEHAIKPLQLQTGSGCRRVLSPAGAVPRRGLQTSDLEFGVSDASGPFTVLPSRRWTGSTNCTCGPQTAPATWGCWTRQPCSTLTPRRTACRRVLSCSPRTLWRRRRCCFACKCRTRHRPASARLSTGWTTAPCSPVAPPPPTWTRCSCGWTGWRWAPTCWKPGGWTPRATGRRGPSRRGPSLTRRRR